MYLLGVRRCPFSLCWRGETVVMPSTSLSHQRFLSLWRDTPQKVMRTPVSGAPQKCFQSGPALAEAGPARESPDLSTYP